MAKASGNTRTSSPSASSGPVVVRLKDNHGEYGAPVTIYGDAKEVAYDEYWHRFTPVVDSNGLSVLENTEETEYGLPDTFSRKEALAMYSDFKMNKKEGYNVDDEHFVFITKNGNIHFADPDESLPKIKMDNVIFIESNDANSTYVWYDNKAADYKKKIYDKTGYRVL